ncbi:MAG: hypothetical protein EOO92_05230 [Pedobacter sp.]|nr:MAG: hypothetical protein EOO92_05230 [Pedobacter sp.]
MKGIYKIILLFVLLFSMACTQEKKLIANKERASKLVALKEAAEAQKKVEDLDSRLSFWKKQLQSQDYAKDSVLKSKIHYNIAGVFYGKNNLDSIKYHMSVAWELMENQSGYDAEKVLLYSGLGNVANKEQKLHQENYYFNRAAQMLYADSSLDVLPKAKTLVYLAAAQSSAKLKQFQTAFKYNRAALVLLPKLEGDVNTQFRAYSQMAICFYSANGDLDSLYSYIKKMEMVYRLKPDHDKERFIADRKAVYFAKKNQMDSVFYYNRKRLAMDISDTEENGETASSIESGNLFLSYVDMIALFTDRKQLDSSLFYINKCETFLKKHADKIDEEHGMLYRRNVVNYLFATKQYSTAEKQHDMLLEDYTRTYEIENARAIAEMSTLINLQAKDKSIYNLNATVALTEERLQSNRLWLLVSVLTVLLTAVLVVLIYYIQKKRSLQNENERSQLEQRLLRTQMEPHFIFNTLSALQSFVRFDEKEKTLKYLNQFGRLLRSSLELSRESLVPLNEEIETLENYLSLQQMRFDHAFTYQFNLHDEMETDSIYIPPMLMQPFVENALLHGINPKAKNGHVYIDFVFQAKLLEVTITDNGEGITILKETPKHTSVSTAISRKRLAIMAKETGLPAGIVIESKPNEGTKIVITIPISYEKLHDANSNDGNV